MKLSIINQSRKTKKDLKLNLNLIGECFATFLAKNPHFKGCKQVVLNFTLCGKNKIKNLNLEYRKKDYATDVLSFGIHENLRDDKGPFYSALPVMELGDIVICREVAKKQAREFKITYEMEVIHLMTHGFLHLLGFDHEISLKEEEIMEKLEQKLVKKIYLKLGLEK